MTVYAVTGASGQLGHRAVEELLDRGVAPSDIVAVARDTARIADLAALGVDVREGDYDRPDTLATALAGVDRLLLVSGSEPGNRVAQHTAVIEAAEAAGVARIAYTSILNADDTSNPLAGEHQATEEVLRGSDLEISLLRNGWYTENYTANLQRYLAEGRIVGAAGEGTVSAASRADYAAAAVAALVGDTGAFIVHELGGPDFDFPGLAATITEATGTTVVYDDRSVEDLTAALTEGGLDAGTAAFVAGIDGAIAAGDLHTDRTDLSDLLGRPATTIADAVRAAV